MRLWAKASARCAGQCLKNRCVGAPDFLPSISLERPTLVVHSFKDSHAPRRTPRFRRFPMSQINSMMSDRMTSPAMTTPMMPSIMSMPMNMQMPMMNMPMNMGMPMTSNMMPSMMNQMAGMMMAPRCIMAMEKIAGGMKCTMMCDDKTAAEMMKNLFMMMQGGMCSMTCMCSGMTTCMCNLGTMGMCKMEMMDMGCTMTCTSGDEMCAKMIQACCDCLMTCMSMPGCSCCMMMNGMPMCCSMAM